MGYGLFLSWADEALFSLGWQSSRDGVSIKIPVPITSLGWCQEGLPAKKKICHTYHEMSSEVIFSLEVNFLKTVQRMPACKMDIKPYMMMTGMVSVLLNLITSSNHRLVKCVR